MKKKVLENLKQGGIKCDRRAWKEFLEEGEFKLGLQE